MDFLVSWILGLIQALWAALVFVANLLYVLILYVYQALVFVVLHVWAALQALARLFVRLWETIIKRGVLKLFELYDRVREWLERVLGPVIRILQRIRQILDSIFNTYIRPILDVIQRVRRVLRVLRLLGFKWAEKLDRRLVAIETAITEAFLFIRGWIVLVQDILERIVDPDLLLTAGIFGGSLGKWLGRLGLLLGAILGDFVPDLFGIFSPSQTVREMNEARAGEKNWLSDAGELGREALTELRSVGQ